MKKAKLFTLLAFVLTLAACNKDKEELRHERDIVYTVAEKTTTVHLNTEGEFDALLDRFCEYAEGGSSVTFYNAASHGKAVQKAQTKDATTYSTSSREVMKRWMRQMEDEGKTVTVTYDSSTGTYNGMAYANASGPTPQCYTGVLVTVPSPQMNEGQTGMVVALKVSEDSILILEKNGQWFWHNGVDIVDLDISVVFVNDSVVKVWGILQQMVDYNGNDFLQLEVGYPIPQPQLVELITYEYDDLDNGFAYIWSFDTVNQQIYISIHDRLEHTLVPDYPVGKYDYQRATEMSNPFAYWLSDSWGDTTKMYYLEFDGSNSICGSNTLQFNSASLGTPVTLTRTEKWRTYYCTDMNLDIVMHVTPADDLYGAENPLCEIQTGSNALDNVDCWTPFNYRCRFLMWGGAINSHNITLYSMPLNMFAEDDTANYIAVNGLKLWGNPYYDDMFEIEISGFGCCSYYTFKRPVDN